MRRLAGPGHLAGPQLVQDLARLGVVPRVVARGLEAGEDIERRDREGRDERDRLERRDDAVPPEQRREPRDAGREVVLAGTGPSLRSTPRSAIERASVRSSSSWSESTCGTVNAELRSALNDGSRRAQMGTRVG